MKKLSILVIGFLFFATASLHSINAQEEEASFIPVNDLKIGDWVFIKGDEENLVPEKITKHEWVEGPIEVYNLTVEGDETYFANNFAVHNKGAVPEPPCGMITVSPDISDPDNQKYKSANLAAYPDYTGQFFEGPRAKYGIAQASDMAGCAFGLQGTCYKKGSKGWDWRSPGNFIGMHIQNTYNCHPGDGFPCNFTYYFKAPDDYLITRIEFDYEKNFSQKYTRFGLSPEVRVGIADPVLNFDPDMVITGKNPDSGHLSFNMEPASKYIYFFGDSVSSEASEYHYMMFRNIKFDLIKVKETDKPDVDVVANIYECGGDPLNPMHSADCPGSDDLCVEKVCLRDENANWNQCDANNKWIYLKDLDPSVIHGYPWVLPSGKANPTVYLKACTFWGNSYCTIFSDSINYSPTPGTITGNVYQNLGGNCSGETDPPSGWKVTCRHETWASAVEAISSGSQFQCKDGTGNTQIPYGLYVISITPPENWSLVTTAQDSSCTNSPTSFTLDATTSGTGPTYYLWQGAQAWFQTQGGDVHGQGSITDPVPDGEYFCKDSSYTPAYPGVVSYVSATEPDFAPDRVSSKGWLANSSYIPGYDYDDFYQKLKLDSSTPAFDCASNTPPADGFYLANNPLGGECVVNSNLDFGTRKVVIFVNGTFKLNQPARIKVSPGGFLAFIVSGDILISGELGDKTAGAFIGTDAHLQGVFLADGVVNTYYDKPEVGQGSKKRLVGAGLFFARNGFNLDRNLYNNVGDPIMNSDTPAELFIFRPDLVLNAPSDLWSSKMSWLEVAP